MSSSGTCDVQEAGSLHPLLPGRPRDPLKLSCSLCLPQTGTQMPPCGAECAGRQLYPCCPGHRNPGLGIRSSYLPFCSLGTQVPRARGGCPLRQCTSQPWYCEGRTGLMDCSELGSRQREPSVLGRPQSHLHSGVTGRESTLHPTSTGLLPPPRVT